MGDTSSFVIQQINESGTAAGDKIELKGRALPYKPYSLKGKMRAEFTWYPGNAVASVQLLGASEDATTIKGKWKDRFIRSIDDDNNTVQPTAIALKNGQQVADAFALVEAVDAIRMAGKLVEVTWDGTIRHGILTSFNPIWQQREIVDWEIEFTWMSRGEAQSPPSFAPPETANTFASKLGDLVGKLQAAVAPLFNLVDDFETKLDEYVNAIIDASLEVSALADDTADLIFTPQNAIERALAAAESVRAAAASIQDLITSTPPRAMERIADPTTLGLGDVLGIDSWSRGVKDAARAIEVQASTDADTLRASARQEDLLATFVARAPTDLRTVSQIYYDTPDEWRRLLQFNALTSSALAIGQLVLVPKLESADRGA